MYSLPQKVKRVPADPLRRLKGCRIMAARSKAQMMISALATGTIADHRDPVDRGQGFREELFIEQQRQAVT